MFSIKNEGVTLNVTLEESVKLDIEQSGVDPCKTYGLVTAFAGEIIASKSNTTYFLIDGGTGIGLAVDVKWSSEIEVLINVIAKIEPENMLVLKGGKIARVCD